jgi:hypothetical protein
MFAFGPRRVVQTGLTPEQALAGLRKSVVEGSLFALDRPKSGPPLRGTIKDNRFELVRRTQFRNSFTPVVEGVIVPGEGGSQVQLVLGMHLVPFSMLLLWVSTTALLGYLASQSDELFQLAVPLVVVSLLGPAVAYLAYRAEVDKVVQDVSIAVTTIP